MSETTVPAEVIVGIDTHKNVHTAVVIAAEAQRAREELARHAAATVAAASAPRVTPQR